MRFLQRLQLREHGTGDDKVKPLGDLHLLLRGKYQLAVEVGIQRNAERLGVPAQLASLRDAGEHLEARARHLFLLVRCASAEIDGGVRREVAVHGGRSELAADRGSELFRVLADDVVEAVVPEAGDAHEGRRAGGRAQLAREIEDALDMVVVHVAHHQPVDRERALAAQPARLADLHEPRLEMRLVDALRAAVDQDEPGLGPGPEVEQQAVALAGAAHVEAEDHGPS